MMNVTVGQNGALQAMYKQLFPLLNQKCILPNNAPQSPLISGQQQIFLETELSDDGEVSSLGQQKSKEIPALNFLKALFATNPLEFECIPRLTKIALLGTVISAIYIAAAVTWGAVGLISAWAAVQIIYIFSFTQVAALFDAAANDLV